MLHLPIGCSSVTASELMKLLRFRIPANFLYGSLLFCSQYPSPPILFYSVHFTVTMCCLEPVRLCSNVEQAWTWQVSISLSEVCISHISTFLFLLFDYDVCLSPLSLSIFFPTDLPKTHCLKGNLCWFVSQFFLSFLHSISKESHPYYQGPTHLFM